MRKLLDSLRPHAVLLAHPGVIEEARRNLSAKKPDWMPGFHSLLGKLQISTQIAPCPETTLPVEVGGENLPGLQHRLHLLWQEGAKQRWAKKKTPSVWRKFHLTTHPEAGYRMT